MDRRFFLSLIAGLMAACASKNKIDVDPVDDGQEGGTPVDEGTILNGTRIEEGNNLYGVITDTEGNPVRNVPVTDGFRFAVTDTNGVYQMKADPKSTHVCYSLPAGYAIRQNAASHLPSFYQTIRPSAVNKKNFTLQKLTGSSSAFSFAVLGDIHIRNASTASMFKGGAMRKIGDYFRENPSEGPVFGISLGDIINNAKDPETFGYAADALGSAEYGSGKYVPFFTVIGNHDHNARKGNSAESGTDGFDIGTEGDFSGTFGPPCYSFNIGKVHFVALDNFIARSEPSSSSTALPATGHNGLSDKVYDWLLRDLALVEDKSSKMVVILQHCHVRGFADVPHRSDMVAKMAEFNSAYIFSGHAHICESYKYTVKTKSGRPVMERIHGVPMGNFWYSKYSPDGAPAGFYVYHVDGKDFSSWEYRCVHNPEEQMRVYDSNDVYDLESDWSHQYAWSNESLFAGGNFLLAHIYHGDEDWEVSLEHDGKAEKMTFANKRIYDYCAHSHLANDNVSGIKTSWTYHWDRSENWWYLKLDRPASELKGWKVVAKAKFPGSTETRTYTCDKITRKLTE